MAKIKSKGKTKKVKNKILAASACIAFAVTAILALADYTGVFTYEELVSVFGLNYSKTVDGKLSVNFINVGQGDCSLIITEGHAALIDAGEAEYGDSVTAYLNAQKIEKLDYVIVTHPHSDHMGGMAEVIDNFEVGKVIVPKISDEMTPTTKIYEQFLKTVQKHNLKLTPAKVGDIYNLGEAEFKILAPNSDDYSSLNNYSVVTYLTYGNSSFLFAGDAESESEKEMLDKDLVPHADVLKVGHHGSNTSTTEKFLKAVDPDYAVIMCGDNSYNHPNEKTIDKLTEYTDKIYRTDQQGTIVFTSDGNELSVSYDK